MNLGEGERNLGQINPFYVLPPRDISLVFVVTVCVLTHVLPTFTSQVVIVVIIKG